MSFITDLLNGIIKPFIDSEKVVYDQLLYPVMDVQRGFYRAVDNISSKAEYTVRDLIETGLTLLDAGIDDLFIFLDKVSINLFDTFQMTSIFTTSIILLLIILNMKHIKQKGINIPSFNIL